MRYSTLWTLLTLVVITIITAGCAIPGLSQAPTPEGIVVPSVTISSPGPNQQIAPGQELMVRSVSVDAQGVVRVELVVDGEVVYVDANAQPEAGVPFIVEQPWMTEVPGSHTIQVRAYTPDNQMGQSDSVIVEVLSETAGPAETEPVEVEQGDPATTVASDSDEVTSLADADTPTPSPFPATLTPTALPNGEDSTPTPTPTTTPTPTVTPSPQKFDPTGYEPDGRFKDIWTELGAGDSRLGYPSGPLITERNYARQPFERGLMVWWDNPEDPNYIWVIDSPAKNLETGRTSNLYADTWDSDQPEVYCEAAEEDGPVRGFGKVWCDHPELIERIGYPTEMERGSGGNPPYAQVQFFQGGAMLYIPHTAELFVLFAQGDWQRFRY
jgi:hypothetical protein